MKHRLINPLSITRRFATTKALQLFAEKFGFVYFNRFPGNQQPSVRGLTVHPKQQDGQCIIGHFQNYDLTFLERTSFIGSHPNHWLIMQIDLHHNDLPHIYATSYPHTAAFYTELFLKFPTLGKADHLFTYHNPMFLRFFRLYTTPQDAARASQLLTTDLTATLGFHFRQFCYELTAEHLYIYAINSLITPNELREMLRVGIWLAHSLDSH